MNDDEDLKKTEGETESDVLKQAKSLLALADLMERYPSVVATRVTGLIYVLISGGIAIATLLYAMLSNAIGYIGDVPSAFIAIFLCLGVAWGVTFRLVIPLAKLYNPDESSAHMSTFIKVTWCIFALLMVPVVYYTFGTGNPTLFPPIIQILLATFNIVNLRESRRGPDALHNDRMQIGFMAVILISAVFMLLLPQLGIAILILVDIGGLFIQGVYMLISAEKTLLQNTGRE